MTTIIVKDCHVEIPSVFQTLEDLRNVLNFMSLEVRELAPSEITTEQKNLLETTKNRPITDFNYLSDADL